MTDQAIDAGAGQEAAPAPETTDTENNTAASDDQGGGISLKLPDDGGDAPAPEAGDGQPAEGGEGGEEAPAIPEGYFKLPGEGATDEERAAFRAAIGVPETADGYGDAAEMIKGIEGLPEGYEPTPWLKELAHSQDMPQSAYEALVKREAEGVAQFMAETTKAAEAERKEAAKDLKAKYGDKTAEKMTLGQRALNELSKDVEGFGEFMAKNGLDQHPKFIEFAIRLGEQFGESAFVDGKGADPKAGQSAAQRKYPYMNP